MPKLSYRDWCANQLRYGNIVDFHAMVVDVLQTHMRVMRYDEIVGILSANYQIFSDEQLRSAVNRELAKGQKPAHNDIIRIRHAHYKWNPPPGSPGHVPAAQK